MTFLSMPQAIFAFGFCTSESFTHPVFYNGLFYHSQHGWLTRIPYGLICQFFSHLKRCSMQNSANLQLHTNRGQYISRVTANCSCRQLAGSGSCAALGLDWEPGVVLHVLSFLSSTCWYVDLFNLSTEPGKLFHPVSSLHAKLNKQLLSLASYTANRHGRVLIFSSNYHTYLHKLFNCSFKIICNGYKSINIKRWRSCDHSRIVSHDVTHVHLDGKLFQVDGEHHQCLPRRPLLTCCLTVLTEGRSRCFCH